jgi:hypothetical protein
MYIMNEYLTHLCNSLPIIKYQIGDMSKLGWLMGLLQHIRSNNPISQSNHGVTNISAYVTYIPAIKMLTATEFT